MKISLLAGAINDVKFHPTLPHLLLSCSKDYSIRLWNSKNSTCVAIFAGIRGHRDEVLSIDIAADGQKFISGGIDHNIMVWSLDSEEINEKIVRSEDVESFGRGPFAARRLHFPEFSTRDVHGNYVDRLVYQSVIFIGLILIFDFLSVSNGLATLSSRNLARTT